MNIEWIRLDANYLNPIKMNFKANHTPNTTCRHCIHVFRLIHRDIREIKSQTQLIRSSLHQQAEEETIYRDANYVVDRVGISLSTLLREQNKGNIQVAKIINRRRLFRDEDVEKFRAIYWRLND